MSDWHAVIVAGPTASGKSALAARLADRIGGVIINADAMQLYRELRILTARPTEADEQRLPHRLYGVHGAAGPASAAWWRERAEAAMAEAAAAGRIPVLCGGSGLYLDALVNGLSRLPQPSPEARGEARALLASLGPARLHARLAAVDPATAARLHPGDSQRLARAYEVWRATGRGLADWQAAERPERSLWRFRAILLDPPRALLRQAIAGRFAAMLEAGALEEARALLALGLDPALPAMRAHGVPELAAHLAGRLTREAAAARAVLVTSQYAKRQATWFRHHALAEPGDTHRIYAQIGGETKLEEINIADLATFVLRPG
ncbi:MAG: tRNA (adenosine(37)-N6)-dimethylallyltransferase MiaA [Acetobacteraceae bacterium]